MKIDGAVIRHGHPGSALKLTEYIDGAVINAGDGSHEHPTQALLDCFSLTESLGDLKDYSHRNQYHDKFQGSQQYHTVDLVILIAHSTFV